MRAAAAQKTFSFGKCRAILSIDDPSAAGIPLWLRPVWRHVSAGKQPAPGTARHARPP
jgi:hypothetical protein